MKPNIINAVGKYMAPGRSWYQRQLGAIGILTVHHTADPFIGTNEQILQREAGFHINGNGWPGLSYHYFICPDGTIYQINSHTDVTWHDSVNTNTLGIAVHGDFTSKMPSQAQLVSLRALLDWLCTENPQFPASQQNVYGHRELSPTACPGNTFFPSVKEYRVNLGNVSWGKPPTQGSADTYVKLAETAAQTMQNSTKTASEQNDPNVKKKLAKVDKICQDVRLFISKLR